MVEEDSHVAYLTCSITIVDYEGRTKAVQRRDTVKKCCYRCHHVGCGDNTAMGEGCSKGRYSSLPSLTK